MKTLCLALAGTAMIASSIAEAQQTQTRASINVPCHEATEVAKGLKKRYAEEPVAFGLQSNGNLLQVYTSKETDTWTVVSTTPEGLSCIIAAGRSWESVVHIKGLGV